MKDSQPQSVTPDKPRMAYLDMTKGILVIFMVVYHALNYSTEYYLAFRYICFLPPSFIFIAGFVISFIYPSRYSPSDASLYFRLSIRGLKLVLLFTALNIGAVLLFGLAAGKPDGGIREFLANWRQMFFVGAGSTAIFDVLLAIGYFLLISPLLLWVGRRHKSSLSVVTVAIVTLCTILNSQGFSLGNLNLVSAGILGMMFGSIAAVKIDAVAKRSFLIASLIAYAIYVPFGISYGYVYLVQLAGALFAVAAIVSASIAIGEGGWLRNRIVRLGQYSLIGYIVHIAILQVLLRVAGRKEPGSLEHWFIFLTALVGMTLIIEGTHLLRKRVQSFDSCYRVFFA